MFQHHGTLLMIQVPSATCVGVVLPSSLSGAEGARQLDSGLCEPKQARDKGHDQEEFFHRQHLQR